MNRQCDECQKMDRTYLISELNLCSTCARDYFNKNNPQPPEVRLPDFPTLSELRIYARQQAIPPEALKQYKSATLNSIQELILETTLNLQVMESIYQEKYFQAAKIREKKLATEFRKLKSQKAAEKTAKEREKMVRSLKGKDRLFYQMTGKLKAEFMEEMYQELKSRIQGESK